MIFRLVLGRFNNIRSMVEKRKSKTNENRLRNNNSVIKVPLTLEYIEGKKKSFTATKEGEEEEDEEKKT